MSPAHICEVLAPNTPQINFYSLWLLPRFHHCLVHFTVYGLLISVFCWCFRMATVGSLSVLSFICWNLQLFTSAWQHMQLSRTYRNTRVWVINTHINNSTKQSQTYETHFWTTALLILAGLAWCSLGCLESIHTCRGQLCPQCDRIPYNPQIHCPLGRRENALLGVESQPQWFKMS